MKAKKLVSLLVAVATAVTVTNLHAVPAQAVHDEDAEGLRSGLNLLSDWLGGLADHDEFGRPLPLLATAPASEDGVGVASLWSDFKTELGTLADPSSVADLASKLDALDLSSGVHTVDVTAAATEPSTGVKGLDVTVTASRTTELPLSVVREKTADEPAVNLTSASGDPGVPVTLVYTATLAVNFDNAQDYFWMSADPLIRLTADADFAFPSGGFPSAVGIADVTVKPGSTLLLDATYDTVVTDSDGDGELAFTEPSGDGVTQSPAELTLPYSDNVAAHRSGTTNASFGIDASLIPDAQDPGAVVTVPAFDLAHTAATPAPTPVVETNAGFDEIAKFENVSSTDLLGGIGQLVLTLKSIQSDSDADVPLPLMDAKFSELQYVTDQLTALVFDQTKTDDANTVENEFGQAKFDTVDGFIAALQNDAVMPGLDDAQLAPTYDPATDQLTFRFKISKPLDTTDQVLNPSGNPLPGDPVVDPNAPVRKIGQLTIGDSLRTYLNGGSADLLTGLSGVTTTEAGEPSTRKRTGYDLDVVFGVNLRDAVPCASDCDIAETTGFVEVDDLPIYHRFFLSTGNDADPEISIDATLTAPVNATKGQVGFLGVEAAAGSVLNYVKRDGTARTQTLNVTVPANPNGSADPTSLQQLLQALGNEDASEVSRTFNMKVTGHLDVLAKGGETDVYDILPGAARIGFDWDDVTQPIQPADLDLTDSDTQLLMAFDFGVSETDALLGNVLDKIDEIANGIKGFGNAATGVADFFNVEIPLVGKKAAALFEQFELMKAKVAEIRAGVAPPTLQQLELLLQQKLGLADTALRFNAGDVRPEGGSPDGTPDLITRLDFTKSIDVPDVPLKFDTSLGDIVGIGSTGTLALAGTSQVKIDFPIALSAAAPGAPTLLETSKLEINLEIDGDPSSSFSVGIGGLELSLGPNSALQVRGKFGAEADDEDANAEESVGLTDFLSRLDGGFLSDPDATCDAPDPDGDDPIADPDAVSAELLCFIAPVYLNDAPISNNPFVTLLLDNDLANPTVTLPTGLDASALAAALINLDFIQDGLAKLKEILTAALKAASFDGKLPFLGDKLDAAADIADRVGEVLTKFATIAAFDGSIGVDEFRQNVLNPIANELESDTLDLLLDSQYPGDADSERSATDVQFKIYCDETAMTLCLEDGTDLASDIERVTVEFAIGRGDTSSPEACADDDTSCRGSVPFDIGLPALGMSTPPGAGIATEFGWRLQLGFGVSKTKGFFLMENPQDAVTGSADATDDIDELVVEAKASLTGGDIAEARLGFIEIGISDDGLRGTADAPDPADHASEVSAGISANFNRVGDSDSDDSSEISIGEIPSMIGQFAEGLQPKLHAEANIDLHLTGSPNIGGTDSKGLPAIEADFLLDWDFDLDIGAGEDLTAAEALPDRITFDAVGFDPGSVVNNALTPIFQDVQRFFEPIDPVREFIFAPVPVISDVAEMFGGDPITYVDLAELFGDIDLSLLEDINDVLEVIEKITNAAAGGYFEIGSFDVVGERAKGGQPTTSEAKEMFADQGDLDQSAKGAATKASVLGTAGTDYKKEIEDTTDPSDSDFTFPILDNPGCVFTMLFNGDCTLVRWEPEPLHLEFEFEIPFGPFFGVLYVTFGGFAGAEARIALGYDTKGLRTAAQKAIETGGVTGSIVGELLDGLFIDDNDAAGNDVPEVTVFAGITVGAELNVGIAAFGARGGIEANVGLNLHEYGPDFDGKIRVDEVLTRILTPLCLFDIEGALEAFLEVYAEIGPCPFCVEKSFELARVRLLDFTVMADCPTADPVLAGDSTPGTVDDTPSGIVTLNVGPNAVNRGAGWHESDALKNEQYVVREYAPGKFTVTALGFTQYYEGSEVHFDAGVGDDVLVFQGSKQDPNDYGAQQPAAAFTVPVIGKGGPGTDNISSGSADDEIYGDGGSEAGEAGNDVISLGAGDDEAHGGDGNDAISGGFGDDNPLNGGNGDDVVDGGVGADTINGGDGNDKLDGGRDVRLNDGTLVPGGEDGADTISGGFDNDVIFAGSGGDTVYGDTAGETGDGNGTADPSADDFPEEDEIHGETGADTIYAGPGTDSGFDTETACGDTVFGDEHGDEIHGQGGPDCINGSGGADKEYGGNGADVLKGDDGDDLLMGQGNSDTIEGAAGNDDIDGGSAADVIYGDFIVATVFGGDSDDVILGGTGADDIKAGPGDDVVVGDDGPLDFDTKVVGVTDDEAAGANDTIRGDAGDDLLYGEGGVDTIRGGVGLDEIRGNGGEDVLFGDSESDTMYGNADNDRIEGGPDGDLMFGNAADDKMFGQGGDDRMIGGSSDDTAADGGDEIHGGSGADRMLGDNGTVTPAFVITLGAAQPAASGAFGEDYMSGGEDDDVMHGQQANDEMYGGTEQDRMFGEQDDDVMHGQAGEDYMLGDSGTAADPVPAPSPDSYPGGAPILDVSLVLPNEGGEDDMFGGPDDDHMYGGAAVDEMHGNSGDDYMEGNGGQDQMYGLNAGIDSGAPSQADLTDALVANLLGDGDQDDMIGGSSAVHPDAVKPDVGEEVMQGNLAQDVMTGDNAEIEGVTENGGTTWGIDPVTLGRARTVTLYDTEKSGADLTAVSGGDFMVGNDANDRMFGQGGGDAMKGNAHDDFLEGNQDADLIEGNGGEDDIVGGSSLVVGTTNGKPNGIGDAGDFIFGGGEADVIAGDNAVITREEVPGDDPYFVTNRLPSELANQRRITLLDLENPAFAANAGEDQISGGAGVDTGFGQDARDYLFGGTEDDYLEGNGDSDFLFGDRDRAAVLGAPPAELPGGLPDIPAPFPASKLSGEPELSGTPGVAGQDDLLGGSKRKLHRDAGDFIYGDGAQDFELGDNGLIERTIVGGAYTRYVDYKPDTIVRTATRYDVGVPAVTGAWGGDTMYGNTGDDYMWGQDGDDVQHGGDGDDDMYGELGNDRMFGDNGEDAMVGDRGVITDRLVTGSGPQVSVDTGGPAFFVYQGLRPGQLDRRVDLLADGDGDVDGDGNLVEAPGLTVGGNDFMRGGRDHDSMHGAFGDDIMNGDSGGDWVFGADGADVLYGGKGNDVAPNDPAVNARSAEGAAVFDSYIDYLFGGHGGDPNTNKYGITLGADVLDYRPRGSFAACGPQVAALADPCEWFLITETHDDVDDNGNLVLDANDASVANNQHHGGIDWIYGGQQRDVLQGNVGKNGPDFGDRLLDWVGAFDLWTRCNASYGDDGDIRQHTPQIQQLLQTMAYGSGVGTSVADVNDPASSAYRELAFVFQGDKGNNGKAFPSTPGHFDSPSCTP